MATPRTQSKHPKPVIGLLGAPGSGKSTVARQFEALGCGVVDADRLAHAALATRPVRDQLVAWWGEGVLDAAGAVDRAAVGRIVFADAEELSRLEKLLHPIVNQRRQAERERLFADPAVVAVIEDTPLLLESGLDQSCDRLVYIDCPFETRLQRVAGSRGWDAAELKRREEQQTPLDIKSRSADDVISNGDGLAHMREQAAAVLQKALDQHRPA